MDHQKLFKSSYVERLMSQVTNGQAINRYIAGQIDIDPGEIMYNPTITPPEKIELIMPDKKNNYEYENSKVIFNAYKNMSPVQATDQRIWTYLAHVEFWDYMQRRYKVEAQDDSSKSGFIIQHWFIESINTKNLLRHGISLLWWGAYLTFDETRKEPFELTKELFSDLDYTRSLVPSTQGRNKQFLHAVLEYVIQNRDVFSKYKEDKIRFIMRKLNYMAGYRIIGSLKKNDIMKILEGFKAEIASVLPT